MESARKLSGKLLKIILALVLVVGLAPMVSPNRAYASSIGAGNTFTVDNLVYKVTAGLNVQLIGVESKDAVPSILTVPDSVDYGDATHSVSSYNVVGITSNAFRDCTNLTDIRIPDLGTGKVFTACFSGCTNLKVIHMMGEGSFSYTGTEDAIDFDGVSDLSIVYHNADFSFDTSGDYNRYTCTFPANTTAYYGIDFTLADGSTQTVYVAGLRSIDGTVTTAATPSTLTDPSSVDVYCDASLGDDALCTVDSVPALPDGCDAWSVSDVDGALVKANSAIDSTGDAVGISSKDLSYASITCANMYVDGTVQHPQPTVEAADGTVLTEGTDYTVSLLKDGAAADAVVGYGTYTVTATGCGAYAGSLSCDITVYPPSSLWYRATGADRYASAYAISSTASVIADRAYTDINGTTGYTNGVTPQTIHRGNATNGYVYSNARVAVNPDDYASCLVGASLAGLFGVTIASVPSELSSDGLSSTVKVQLSTVSKGNVFVVGSASSVSEDMRTAMGECINGTSTRVSGKAESAADIAVNTYQFIRKVEDGTYSLELPTCYLSYGDTAIVMTTEEDASMFTVASWACAHQAPILFCNDDGSLSDATLSVLNDTDAEGNRYFTKVVMPGATAAQLAKLKAALPGVQVSAWTGAAETDDASMAYASRAVDAGESSYGVTVLASDDEDDWGCLSAAAATAGAHNGTLLLRDFDDEDAVVASIEGFAFKISYGVLAGSYDVIPQSVYEEITRLWDAASGEGGYENMRFATLKVLTPTIKATGSAVAPQVEVYDADGHFLTEGKSGAYTLTYIDNSTGKAVAVGSLKQPGSYTVVATGTKYSVEVGWRGQELYDTYGTYYNTRSATFTIEAPQGWQQNADGKWTYYADGSLVTGWKKIGSVYYYFDASGIMQTGWLKSGSTYYYLASSGKMVTGWQKIGGKYYYFASSGKMCTGWLKSGSTYYYLKPLGAMATGWQAISGSYYYFASSGKMYASKWLKSSGKWYWFKASGKMAKSETLTISGKKYTFLKSGALK